MSSAYHFTSLQYLYPKFSVEMPRIRQFTSTSIIAAYNGILECHSSDRSMIIMLHKFDSAAHHSMNGAFQSSPDLHLQDYKTEYGVMSLRSMTLTQICMHIPSCAWVSELVDPEEEPM